VVEGLSDLFYDCPPVKEFRRRYTLTRMAAEAVPERAAQAYKMFAGAKKPNIGILEFRDPTGRSEYEIFRELFQREGSTPRL